MRRDEDAGLIASFVAMPARRQKLYP